MRMARLVLTGLVGSVLLLNVAGALALADDGHKGDRDGKGPGDHPAIAQNQNVNGDVHRQVPNRGPQNAPERAAIVTNTVTRAGTKNSKNSKNTNSRSKVRASVTGTNSASKMAPASVTGTNSASKAAATNASVTKDQAAPSVGSLSRSMSVSIER